MTAHSCSSCWSRGPSPGCSKIISPAAMTTTSCSSASSCLSNGSVKRAHPLVNRCTHRKTHVIHHAVVVRAFPSDVPQGHVGERSTHKNRLCRDRRSDVLDRAGTTHGRQPRG